MRISFLIFVCAVLALSVFLHMRSENITDPDGFYHFRHAALYADGRILDSSFPWLPYSTIGEFSSDLWYGFHVILIPFTRISDSIYGMRVAGIAITAVALVLFYWAASRLGILYSYIWPFALLFASPFMVLRLTMLRPHVISVAVVALLFAFFVRSAPRGVFFAAAALAFLHINLFWIAFLIFGVCAVVKILTERLFDWRSSVGLVAGLFLGWVLRPNAWGTAKLLYVQIFQFAFEKQKGTPLHFGTELLPPPFLDFVAAFWIFLVLWGLAIAVFLYDFRKNKNNEKAVWASGILSFAFFLMAVFIAQRSMDFWAAFGILFIALVFSRQKIFIGVVAAVFIAMAALGIYRSGENLKIFAFEPRRFQGAAEWLKNNANPDEIVLNTAWEYFGELFFWNSNNRYVSGMDPIFQYTYNPALYWKSYYWETGKTAENTCATASCLVAELEDTHTVLKLDFKASYVFLSRFADRNFYSFMKSDSRFTLEYEQEEGAVFKVK